MQGGIKPFGSCRWGGYGKRVRGEKALECLTVLFSFLFKRGKEKVEEKKNFSALVTGQYEFLVTQLEKVLKDYFGLSAQIKEMHAEIFSLKTELAKALPISVHAMTAAKDCLKRVCDVISLFSSNRLG